MRNLIVKCLLFCVAAGLVASVALGAAPPKGWQNLQLGKDDGVFPLGFASGRVWFVVEDNRSNDLLESARVGSTGLSSLVVTPEGQNPWLPSAYIVGSSLVTLQGHSSGIAPLLASGRMGATTPLPGDPEKTASDAFAPQGMSPDSWFARAAVNVGGRTIWAINGHSCPNGGPHRCTASGGGFSSLVMCCTAGGQASDLTSLLSAPTKAGATGLAMGVDAHRRVWLAWMDGAQAHATTGPVEIKLAQIDPTTLKARSTKSLNTFLALFGVSSPFALACTDACRAVYESRTGVFSWGGDGPATRILAADPRRGTGGHLMAASGGGSTVRIASLSVDVANPDRGQLLTVSRGDARGRNLHAVSSVAVPQNLPAGGTHYFYPYTEPVSILTPSSLVVLALYGGGPGGTSRLLDAVLRG